VVEGWRVDEVGTQKVVDLDSKLQMKKKKKRSSLKNR
jgi:hypothetical protein